MDKCYKKNNCIIDKSDKKINYLNNPISCIPFYYFPIFLIIYEIIKIIGIIRTILNIIWILYFFLPKILIFYYTTLNIHKFYTKVLNNNSNQNIGINFKFEIQVIFSKGFALIWNMFDFINFKDYYESNLLCNFNFDKNYIIENIQLKLTDIYSFKEIENKSIICEKKNK